MDLNLTVSQVGITEVYADSDINPLYLITTIHEDGTVTITTVPQQLISIEMFTTSNIIAVARLTKMYGFETIRYDIRRATTDDKGNRLIWEEKISLSDGSNLD